MTRIKKTFLASFQGQSETENVKLTPDGIKLHTRTHGYFEKL